MLARSRTFWRAIFRRKAVERELDEEMRFHVDKLTEENVALGMDAQAARLAAARSFGGLEQAKEECRDARGTMLVEGLYRDLRHGLRALLPVPLLPR